jgi:hypothetical protein
MPVKNQKGRRFIVVATLGLSLLGWGVAGYFREGYQQLPDLNKITAPLRHVSIQRTQGKNAFYYLAFAVGTNSRPFGIRAAASEQALTQLLRKMQLGSTLTIYYATPRWGTGPINFEVRQIEDASYVIYSIEEVQQRALAHAAWALIGWFILAVITLWLYWQQRPAFISEP